MPLISCENPDMQTRKPGLLSNRLTTNHKSTYLKGSTDQHNEGSSTQGKWLCLIETNNEDSDEVELFSVKNSKSK